MRKLTVSTLVSLDGVIQDPGGFGETEHGGWAGEFFDDEAQRVALEHLLASDLFLTGRVTYQVLAASWSKNREGVYMARMYDIPKLVASTTLSGPLEWNAELLRGNVPDAVADLKRQPGGDILMYGSATLMRTLMRHDLIDEYLIWINPVVLGSGTRLFEPDGTHAKLRLADTKTLPSGAVILTYHPRRD